jgi:hypothetical protein
MLVLIAGVSAACGTVERVVGTPLPTMDADPPAGWAWHDAPRGHRGEVGRTLDYVCPAGGGFGPIWGTDVYTDDSSVCTAAVHMGLLDRENGGRVRIMLRPGQDVYPGSLRNGVVSESYESWGGSFVVVATCRSDGCAPTPP